MHLLTGIRVTRPPPERRKRNIRILVDRRKHDDDYADRLVGGVRATRTPPSQVQDRHKRNPPKNR
jgi:hypothetical protein